MTDFKCTKCNKSWNNENETCGDCKNFNYYYDDFGMCVITYRYKSITSFCDVLKKDKRFNTCPGCQMVYDHEMTPGIMDVEEK